MDYCNLTFGVGPCTATGTKCYNTFPTTKDAPNYDKGEKEYKYVNEGLPLSVINDYYPAKPYIKSFNDLPTEIKEKDTVVKRLKIQLYDEDDNDVGVDPYRSDRTTITGTYWKKWLARNSNYKGRIVELHEGFEDLAEGSFELKFAGRIDNIAINKGIVTIEAVDLLKKMSEIEYPLDRGVSLAILHGNLHIVNSQSAMLATGALIYDWAQRTDFESLTGIGPTTVYDPAGTLNVGDQYQYYYIAYDEEDRPFARKTGIVMGVIIGAGKNAVDLSWTADADASYYRVYRRFASGDNSYVYYTVTAPTVSYRDLGTGYTSGIPPGEAEIFYRLSGEDPTSIGNWAKTHQSINIFLDSNTDLDSSGYVLINKEVIYYGSIVSSSPYYVLQSTKRRQFSTSPDRYEIGTGIRALLKLDAGNPFTHLKTLLDNAGIASAYIDTKFTTYESAWGGVDFSTRVIIKKIKLSKIYFQLVNAVDCMSWVGEDGKIKILNHTENPAAYATITDAANIILDSAKVDLNEGSRRTRWLLYWNRYDLEKGIEDEGSYNRANVVVDATAESSDEYNDEQEDLQYCTFLNDDSDVVADINTWITDTLLDNRKSRTRDAQTFFYCDVELKDNDIKTGDIIKLSTDKLQDKDGVDYSEIEFRVIKKEPKGNKISLKLIRRFSTRAFDSGFSAGFS